MIQLIINFILKLFGINRQAENGDVIQNKSTYWYTYTKKKIMTSTEIKFYEMFKTIIGEQYIVFPQINLASIISKKGNNYYKRQNELYRNIDFGIFDKNTFELLLLIEINDESHNLNPKTKKRDRKVDKLCDETGYKLIKFWTNKPNDYNYVKSRLLEYLSFGGNKTLSNYPNYVEKNTENKL